ncbi:MAG: hypothetical protein GFH27_549293n258 [Chloroflexi bacterium AL-W]|nr:hypothetical protein [Chloroflexi bacterium AL-N1]NOK67627.1 hypothetical protein [Chloroflexi bacterium AL-N10]NOK75603.1 hypothetical protein [Chloroflexi bacterium AL-N5]NOK82391.1 hypothetical protein [Chloroflexi bacterium AL-W]NOK90236.1 hypothetical protein [Chloroflexi bacterium AL-N15]
MNVLVDGHNVIGQLPDIHLSDPDDEAKLVMLLRRYATQKRGRKVVVVFDHGVYGHPQQLNGYGVTCHFARSPQDADTQITRRIQSLKRPKDWLLVSSDRQLIQVAEAHGVRVMRAQDFVAQLRLSNAAKVPKEGEKPEQYPTTAEVKEWLRLFGEEEGQDDAKK